MDFNAMPSQTPDWWLERLLRELVRRQTHYQALEDWDVGNHPLPEVDRRYREAMLVLQELARTNYYGAITKAPVERMRLKGFRWGSEAPKPAPKPVVSPAPPKPGAEPPDFPSQAPQQSSELAGNTGLDADVAEIWSQNDMALQEKLVYGDASRYGHGYLLVSESDEGARWPTITYEDTRQCVVDPDPSRPGRFRAGLKFWNDDVLNCTIAMLFLPDRIHCWTGAQMHGGLYIPYADTDIARSYLNSGSPFALEYQGAMPNALEDIPLVMYQWRPDGMAEAEDLIDIQRRINHTMLDRLKITRDQAFRQKWITGGMELLDAAKRTGKIPLSPGSDAVWILGEEQARMGDFEIADITQILQAISEDIMQMASMARHPAHYLMGTMSNVSGDTLGQAEAAFVAKIKQRQEMSGWAHERLLKTVFRMAGNSKADEPDAHAVWFDPEVRTLAENVDSSVKYLQAGLPPTIVLSHYSTFSAEEIIECEQFIERRRQENMAIQQQQMALNAQKNADDAKAKQAAAEGKGKPAPGKPAAKSGSSSKPAAKSAK